MSDQSEIRIAELEAHVDVLRTYLQALLGFLPREPITSQVIGQVTRDLHAEAAKAGPRKEALDKAIARVNAMANSAKYGKLIQGAAPRAPGAASLGSSDVETAMRIGPHLWTAHA